MGLEQRVATLEARSEQQDSKIDALRDEMNRRFDEVDRRFGQMQEFNQQTQDLVRAIYFAVKNEQPPK